MAQLDCPHPGRLDFDGLGDFMFRLGAYRFIYNPAYDIEFSGDGIIKKLNWGSEAKNERYNLPAVRACVEREIDFHIHFWSLLDARARSEVDGELVVKVAGLLYESDSASGEVLAQRIEREYIGS